MSIPRNAIARSARTKLARSGTHEINRRTAELDTICQKHKAGELTFRSCKYAMDDGKQIFIEHDYICGNMKCGITIVRADTLTPSEETIYDLVEVANAKKKRDEKTREEETKKAMAEFERLQKNDAIDTSPEDASKEHQDLVKKMDDGMNGSEENAEPTTAEPTAESTAESTESTAESTAESTESTAEPAAPIAESTVAPIAEPTAESTAEPTAESTAGPTAESAEPTTESAKKRKPKNKRQKLLMKQQKQLNKSPETVVPQPKESRSAKNKRDKALKQMAEQLAQKAEAEQGNKYYRRFMDDIKSKFTLEAQSNIKYFEVKANSTDMVIEDPTVYKLVMPATAKQTYLLIIGDLQMKSAIVRRIDPAYKAEVMFKEQNDFLERIKAKENAKTEGLNEMTLEDELDDLEDLGVSSDEDETIPDLMPV